MRNFAKKKKIRFRLVMAHHKNNGTCKGAVIFVVHA